MAFGLPPTSLRTPFLLQDMCMIHVLLRIEDFPVQSIALLSHAIRRKIFFGLSYVDILHLGDSLDSPADVDVAVRMIDARQCLLGELFYGPSDCQCLSVNIGSALREHYDNDDCDLHAHICECYPSLEPTHLYGFLFPKRSLPFLDWKLQKDGPNLRTSPVSLLHYCNIHSAPTELKINCCFIWKEFDEYMRDIRNDPNDRFVGIISNPKIYLVIPLIQQFLSTVEVLELGTYNHLFSSKRETTGPYILLYNILTSNRPCLKHIKVLGIPDFIRHVMSTVVELLHATCTAPSKSIFHQYTGLEPLSLPTTPYVLEGISVMPEDYEQDDYYYEFMTASCASSISRDMMSVVQLHMHKLKSVAVNNLGYCCDLDRMTIVDGHVTSGKFNINVPEYRKFLMLLVEFIKQPQFTELTVVKSPLPEGFELIIAFLCTPTSHEQTLIIEASSKRSVEKAEDDDNEEEEDEEIWIVNMEDQKKETDCLCETPPKKKSKSHLPMKPPCFPSESLPLTNAQFKCLDLGQSSDMVYIWLFNQLPELKLKSLKMRTLRCFVPPIVVVQVEHVAFNLGGFESSKEPTISTAYLEKFVISNPALKRLEFENDWDEEDSEESFLPALNHCLLKLDQQGRGPEELILTFVQLDKLDETQLEEFFVRVRDLSHHHGTILVLSLYRFSKIADSDFYTSLSKKFQENKIKKIVCYTPDVDPTPQLELIAESVNVTHCKPPHIYYADCMC